MNYKSLTIIALVLLAMCVVVPGSAMWNNGNWVSEDHNTKCDSVKFDPQTGVTSCYHDVNPVKVLSASNEGNGGWAEGSIRAGFSTLSNSIEVRNVLQPANTTGMHIEVYPDATFRIPAAGDGVLAPGNYTATLDNFNLPDETVEFTIAANQQEPTRISFIGQAASNPDVVESAPVSSCKDLDITYAAYGGNYSKPLWWNLLHFNTFYIVTHKVRSMVSNDFLHIPADYSHQNYNALFGDPYVGTVKGLYVLYTCKETKVICDGKHSHTITIEVPHKAWVSETQDLNIPSI